MLAVAASSFIPQTETPRREQFALLPFSIIQALSGSVTRSGIVVYCALAAHADPSGHCWPGRARLGEITGLNERQVSRATAELEKKGLLRKEYRAAGRVDYWLLPVSPRSSPPVTDDTSPLSSASPRTAQGTSQKEQGEPMPPATPPEPAAVPPIGALSIEDEEPEPAPQPNPAPRPAVKAAVIPLQSKTQLPDGWTLSEDWRVWAQQQRPDLADLDAIAANFRDYHLSKATRSASWVAEWRRWINRERGPKAAVQRLQAAKAPNPYAPLTGPKAPVSAAVQAALEQGEQRRVEMLLKAGIDPKTGLRMGVDPMASPPSGPSPLADGSPLPSGERESAEDYRRRIEQHRRYQLERLAALMAGRAKE